MQAATTQRIDDRPRATTRPSTGSMDGAAARDDAVTHARRARAWTSVRTEADPSVDSKTGDGVDVREQRRGNVGKVDQRPPRYMRGRLLPCGLIWGAWGERRPKIRWTFGRNASHPLDDRPKTR